MTSHCDAAARRGSIHLFCALTLTLAGLAPCAAGQSADTRAAETKSTPEIDRIVFLSNLTQQQELNDVQTDLRNMLGRVKIYGIASQNALSIHGTPEDVQSAEKLIAELDRPRKIYRLTYTIVETDNGTRRGTQTFALVAAAGERTIFKQGSRVPIVTGSYDSDKSKANTQVQYLDVGLSIDFTLEASTAGLSLRSKVEQSDVAEEKSGLGAQDPIVRQTVLDSTSSLVPGKPLTLGSLDIPATARKQEIQVVAEPVK